MTRWSDLSKQQKYALMTFGVLVAIVIILAWYGYFTGAWETPPQGT